MISAGFSAYRATPCARRFFKKYVETYKKLLKGANEVHSGAHWKSFLGEQHVLTRMLAERDAPSVFWLDACALSANGMWYEDETYRARCNAPKVVQNNYIIGNTAKILRAKIWGHWFVDDSGARCRVDHENTPTFPGVKLSRGIETCKDASVRSTTSLGVPPIPRQDYDKRDENTLHVLYINRKKRGDRNRAVFAELTKANFTHITRIEAEEVFTDAHILESCWDPAMQRKCAGQIGCQRSHLKAIRHAVSRGWSFVAIFEDDFRWLPHVDPVQFAFIIEHVRVSLTEWDVIGVSHNIIEHENVYIGPRDSIFSIPLSSSTRIDVIRVTRALGTHAYIVRARAYAALIRVFEACDTRRDLETAIDTCWHPLQRKLNWYGFAPQLGTQADGFSDIEQRHVSYGIS